MTSVNQPKLGDKSTLFTGHRNLDHRLLLLKLDKQIRGTIYRPILSANKACHMEEVGCHVRGGGVHASSMDLYSKGTSGQKNIVLTLVLSLYVPSYRGPCLIGCRLPPLNGYVAVCLVLTIEVYALIYVPGFLYTSCLPMSRTTLGSGSSSSGRT